MDILSVLVLYLVECICEAKAGQMLMELVMLLMLSEFLDYVLDLFALLAFTLRELPESQSFVLGPGLSFSRGSHLRLYDKLFC